MVRVGRDNRQADRWMCYAAFALVLDKNKRTSAAGIQQVICDKFSRRFKYVNKLSLAAILSSQENSDLVSRLDARQCYYALTPEFYRMLILQIEVEKKCLLELCDRPYSAEAGVMWLYERMRGSKLPPTLPSIFRQAR